MKVDLFSVDTKKASEVSKDNCIASPQDPCTQEDVDLMNKLLKGDPQEKQFMDWLTSIENSINKENIQAANEDEQLSEIVSDFVSELKSKKALEKDTLPGTADIKETVAAKESAAIKETIATIKETPIKDLTEKKNKNITEVVAQKEPLTQEKPLEQPLIQVAATPVIENINQAEMKTVGAPHAIELAQQIKDQMVDRILVSSSDLNENREVILKLNPNLLAETQVSFQKVGQALQVQFMSQNTDSLKFLSVFQLDLQGYLQDELKNFRGVSVRIHQGNTDMGQPQDGRSRNPYEYQNLDDDNDPTFIA